MLHDDRVLANRCWLGVWSAFRIHSIDVSGRFLRAILPSSLEATFCTEGFRITISLRSSGVDRAGHFSDADWVQNEYGLPKLS